MAISTRHGVRGVYFSDVLDRPRFIVVVDTDRWVSCLSPYYEEALQSEKNPDFYSLSFCFHSLYSAMLLYPPFANAILDTEKFSRNNLMSAFYAFPELSGKLNPLTIKMSYDYVTPQEEE